VDTRRLHLFSGNTTGDGAAAHVGGVGPRRRSRCSACWRFIVYDAADGRWLAVREDLSFGVRLPVPGSETERALSWLGSAGARGLSMDGQWLLMVDVGPRAGRNYGVVLRKTDGSQAIRLGEGSAQRLSPDARWAAAIIAAPPQLVLYPTGSGEAVRIANGVLEGLNSVEWFPDGQQLLVCGSEATRAPRCYRQDLAGSPPVPVTPEGVMASVAPDGRTLLLRLSDGAFQLSSVDGGTPRPVSGLAAGDRHIAWSRDSQAVYVQQGLQAPAAVERVELATGKRSVVGRLATQGLDAIASVSVVDWVDDGRAYVSLHEPSVALFVVRSDRQTRAVSLKDRIISDES
jgi:hypothetical protein